MNKIIESYVQEVYGIDISKGTTEDFQKVTEIIVPDSEIKSESKEWDFSIFPNLTKIDCRLNRIDKLIISANSKLEDICFYGTRGRNLEKVDFSGNPCLKSVWSGQDNLTELDFSSNHNLENLTITLSSSLRWIDLDNCYNLKRIEMIGTLIPFVDLTHCLNLEYVNINYLNQYCRKYDEYGPGYPRPFIFVDYDFDESIINKSTRENSYFTYYLIKVKAGSIEENFLNELKSMKKKMLAIGDDLRGKFLAIQHYKLLDIYESMLSNK